MEKWQEEDVINRQDSSQLNRVVHLMWKEASASYVIEFPNDEDHRRINRDQFVFSLGDLSEQSMEAPQITVEMTSSNGATARVDMKDHPPIPKPILTKYLKTKWVEKSIRDAGLSTSTEPVMQSYHIPLSDFVAQNSDFDPTELQAIRFVFNSEAGGGAVMLDNIGFYLSPRL